MKRNLVLTVLLGLLVWGGWLLERHNGFRKMGVLVPSDWEKVVAIEMPEVVLKKVAGRWMVPGTGRLVDVGKVKELWGAWGKIEREREVTGQGIPRKQAFPTHSDRLAVQFEEGRLEIVLGSKLRFDRSFYLETVDTRDSVKSVRWWIARDHGGEPGIYNVKTVYRSSAQYQKIKSLLRLKADDFYPDAPKERT